VGKLGKVESAEPFPEGAVEAPDLAQLVARSGPFLSVYLHTDPDVQKAPQRSEQGWKTLRSELESSGVPDHLLAQIEPDLPEAHKHGRMLGFVTDGHGSSHVEHGHPSHTQDLGRFGPVPYLAPMLRWRQSSPPYVVVLIDRTGADVYAIHHGAPDDVEEVKGKDFPITKVGAGGWSQRRYQERAENTWEQNAESVAEVVGRLAHRIGARFVAVSGDVRANSLLREALHKDVHPLLREVSGGRPHGRSGDPIPGEVDDLVTGFVDAQSDAITERLREEVGQGDLGAEGTKAVVAALARGQVEILLIADYPDDDSTLWIGAKPSEVATSADELRELGLDEPVEARRLDALVHAALGTDAKIRIVEQESAPTDGVGALLRWKDEATSRW
jgi:hypothetical protein